jgi:transcription initiation factor TFIID subunit 5
MEDEEMEKKVQQYLHRKGFRLTELALQEERNRLSTTSLSDVSLSRSVSRCRVRWPQRP